MGIFAYADLPESANLVGGVPFVLSVLACLLWVRGRSAELKHGSGPWKWWAVVPLFAALYVGAGPFFRLHDFLYKDAIQMLGGRMMAAHYVGFFFPLACVLGLGAFEALDRRAARLAEER